MFRESQVLIDEKDCFERESSVGSVRVCYRLGKHTSTVSIRSEYGGRGAVYGKLFSEKWGPKVEALTKITGYFNAAVTPDHSAKERADLEIYKGGVIMFHI